MRPPLPQPGPDGTSWEQDAAGRLRPGLTVSLARYARRLHLVARTAPAWADADQRITLALWDGATGGVHPHPRPNRRFRLDLHRHLWDARHASELHERAGAATWPGDTDGFAVHRWQAEADILRQAEGRFDEPVFVRVNARDHRELTAAPTRSGVSRDSLVLPDAATWVLPDLELLRAGLIEPGQLHPLVADALAPGHPPSAPAPDPGAPRLVDCRGQRHRIGLVGGVLSALDHGPEELRREEILVAFGGPPMPCLRVIDEALRHPESLADIRARLDHGDLPGALRAVEALLGPGAVLRDGPLRDELARTERQHLTYGLYRAGLTGHCPPKNVPRRHKKVRK
jgi:hypothetical protein